MRLENLRKSLFPSTCLLLLSLLKAALHLLFTHSKASRTSLAPILFDFSTIKNPLPIRSQMAGYDCLPMKMKRKEIDRVNDEFSDFCLSSPARKIRRLDLDLPPIMEEEEIQSPTVNEERAIVVFKPPQHHYQSSPSSGQLFVDRNLISGFKNRFLHNGGLDDDYYDDDEDEETNKDQAIVCWNPSQFQFLESRGDVQEPRGVEIVELDGEDTMMEEADMDVDEGNSVGSVSLPQIQQQVPGGSSYQWQQQLHCMVPPQIPQTNSTPISWFR